MPNHVAIYIRVSTEEQKKGYSLDAQLNELRAYAAQHQMPLYKEYIDAGYSGSSITGRPAMLELLSDAKKGKFNTVISWKLNRMARNLIDQLKMLEIFKQQNINYLSLTEHFETNTPQGIFMLQMLGAVAQLEREQIAQNVRLAMQERSKKGEWNCGNNVLGYAWNSDADHTKARVLIVPHEAELVQRIFNEYSSKMGFKAIINRLNAAGYRTKMDKPFSIASIRGILTNVNYIGLIRYTVNDKFTGATNDRTKQVVQGQHEPIIQMELWHEVQKLLNQKFKLPTKTIPHHYLLAGLLKCPMCGNSMVPSHTKAIRKNGNIHMNHYYICGNYSNRGSSVCRGNRVAASSIEDATLLRFHSMLTNKSLLNELVSRLNRREKETREPLTQQLAGIETEMQQIERRQRRCFEMFEDGHLQHTDLLAKIDTFKYTLAALNKSKYQLEAEIEEHQGRMVTLNDVQLAMTSFIETFNIIEDDKKNALLRGFIQSIHIPPDRDVTGIQIQTTSIINYLII